MCRTFFLDRIESLIGHTDQGKRKSSLNQLSKEKINKLRGYLCSRYYNNR
jgi:hypothetical protein